MFKYTLWIVNEKRKEESSDYLCIYKLTATTQYSADTNNPPKLTEMYHDQCRNKVWGTEPLPLGSDFQNEREHCWVY